MQLLENCKLHMRLIFLPDGAGLLLVSLDSQEMFLYSKVKGPR